MKIVTIVPLIGSNYPSAVSYRPSGESQADKFVARRDRALTIIVLAVDPSLLMIQITLLLCGRNLRFSFRKRPGVTSWNYTISCILYA